MANVKITDLVAYTDPVSTDVLAVVDVGADITKKVSIADLLENAGSGTAAAPGIAFDGDSNTGIYRPGADQVAISTNGAGRLFVDSSGNVAVSANTEVYPFTVTRSNPASGNLIGVKNSGTSSLTGCNIVFSQNTVDNWRIGQPAGENAFAIARSTTGVNEYFRITSDGKLGLGTSSAISDIHVLGTTGARFQNSSDTDAQFLLTYSSNSPDFRMLDTTGATTIKLLASGDSWFTGGNVGIGDTSPDRKLQVINSTDALMRLGRSDASSHGSTDVEIKFSKDYYSNAVFEAASHRFEIQGTEKVRIDSAGRVGIGLSNPGDYSGVSKDLVVGNHSGARGITIAAQSNNTGYLSWADGTSTVAEQRAGRISYSHPTDSMRFDTAASERMRIDSQGNVGIGSTAPGQKLVVKDTSAASTSVYINVISGNTGNAGIIFGDSDADSRAGVLYNNDGSFKVFQKRI